MDSSLTPDLSSAIAQLGQYYPLTGSTDQSGAGSGMAGMLGGSNAEAADYTGQFSDIRGLVDKGNSQITSLAQANSVLGGQINSFGGTLTGIQSGQSQTNSAVADMNKQMQVNAQNQSNMQKSIDGAMTQIGGINTNITGVKTGVDTLQSNDAGQTAYMLRLGKALEQVKSGIKV